MERLERAISCPYQLTSCTSLIGRSLSFTSTLSRRGEPPGEEDEQELLVVPFRAASSATRPHWDPDANSKTKG